MLYVPNQTHFFRLKNGSKGYVNVVPMAPPAMSATWCIVICTCSHEEMSSHEQNGE
jgi:hypothetical protein